MERFKIIALLVFIVASTSLKSQVNCSYGNTISSSAICPSAIGYSNTVNGNYALAGGINARANGECSFGFGNTVYATGKNSLAFGSESEATKEYSIAMGHLAKATGNSAIAIGLDVQVPAIQSVGIGRNLRSTAGGGYILGMGYSLDQPLINNIPFSLMIGFNSTAPTFFISNSINGIGTTATGKIGIGNVTNPLSKLHIRADENEAAEIRLEHQTTGIRQYAQIWMGAHSIRAGNTENMVFTVHSGRNFSFLAGKVGIGTDAPTQVLDVDGNIRIRNNGAIGAWSDHSLNFVTNGKNRMTLTGNGNVGIGTITPLVLLHVEGGNTYLNGNLQVGTILNGKTTALLGNVGIGTINPTAALQVEGGSTFLNGNLQVGSHRGDKLVSFYGKVGIGTDNPLATLQVNGSVSIGYEAFPAPGTNNLIVNGQVGIGTFTPSAPLEVNGKIKTSQIQLSTGYMNGYILKCDEYGNGFWASPSTIDDGDWIVNGNIITVDGFKMVGIGTANPAERLDVNGSIRLNGNIKGGRTDWQTLKIFANSSETDGSYISLANNITGTGSIKLYSTGTNGRIEFHNQNLQVMSIRGDNHVYFGNPETNTNLFVNGEISANLVRVNAQEWWDCVFDDGYELPVLSEVEAYVKAYKHLPGIPAESDVKAKGVDLAMMNALLLKKVEELTLYVIALEKKINNQSNSLQK